MLGFEAKDGVRQRRKRRKKDLSLDELNEILGLISREEVTHQKAAWLFNVKPSLIRNLVKNEASGANSVL